MERLRPGAVCACMQYALKRDAGASQSFGGGIARRVWQEWGVLGALTWHGEHADDLVELKEGTCEHISHTLVPLQRLPERLHITITATATHLASHAP